MADELTSIHGRRLGLTDTDFLTGCDDAQKNGNFAGLLIGNRGRGFQVVAPRYGTQAYDDFLGAIIRADLWSLNKGSDGSAANFAILAAQPNGVVRGTTGANASADMAGNGIQIVGGRNFTVSNGPMAFEASILPAAITTTNFFVGWTDTTIGTLQAPFTISGAVVTANCVNGVGFVFDTSATASTTKLVSVFNSGTPQLVELSGTPSITLFGRYRVEVLANGSAIAFLNGVQVGAVLAGTSNTITLAVQTTAILAPKVSNFRRAASATNFDLDFLYAQQAFTTLR